MFPSLRPHQPLSDICRRPVRKSYMALAICPRTEEWVCRGCQTTLTYGYHGERGGAISVNSNNTDPFQATACCPGCGYFNYKRDVIICHQILSYSCVIVDLPERQRPSGRSTIAWHETHGGSVTIDQHEIQILTQRGYLRMPAGVSTKGRYCTIGSGICLLVMTPEGSSVAA